MMPTTIFDWAVRTAMLAMAGLVTLSILGAIDAMTDDTGTRFAVPGDRPLIEGAQAEDRQRAQAPPPPEPGHSAEGPQSGPRGGAGVVAEAAAPEDEEERWLEAIAYALLALAGIGALGVLMLSNVVRELRRIGSERR
jgi:hypothetical protein